MTVPQPIRRGAHGFTLLEVMIAVAIFFMVAFSVLALVSQNLRAARALQTSHISAAMRAAELALTNKLVEGTESGDFGELYPGFTWLQDVYLVSSNGLWQVELAVINGAVIESEMTILLYKPEGVTGVGAGIRRRNP
ncbi:MAG TPA: prepilin-type N-terminal cleavage/methylation domain-containing protein [Verrucomicrobiae bacterium]|jgi:type II secretion system protein I